MKKTVLFFLFSTFAMTGALADLPSPLLSPQLEQVAKLHPRQSVLPQSTEILLLREQNKLLKEFQSSQQTTVYWALSGILGFVFILTGLSLFTNFKFYEQDKDRLKREFEDKISAYRSEFGLQLESHKGEVLQIVDHKNQAMQDRVFSQLSEARSLIESVRSEVLADVKKTSSDIQDSNAQIASVRKNLEAAEVELRDVESVVWAIKDIPGNILITKSQGVRAAVNAGSEYDVKRLIKSIGELLDEKFKKTGLEIDPFVADRLYDCFKNCEGMDADGVAKARETLDGIPVGDKKPLS